jgi:cytochrome c-type biogenesis protein CcmH/NrfG
MIMLIGIGIALGTLIYLGYPILRRDLSYAPEYVAGLAQVEELRSEKDALIRAIKDLEFDLASGKLSPTDYTSMRGQYEARAVGVLQELDAQEGALRKGAQASQPERSPVFNPLEASRRLWARPVFAMSVLGALLLIVGGGGFLLGRVTQNQTPAEMSRQGRQDGGTAMESALEARLQQNPRDLEALIGLGRVYLQAGQMPKAIEVYKRALEIDHSNVSALSGMAMILAQAGHSDQALILFDKVLAVNPQTPMALLFKGRILFEDKKDYAGAIANWEKFLSVMPQGEPAEVVRGWIDEAQREARKMTGAGPSRKIP